MVGRVLAAHFKTYLSAMEKMVSPVAGQGDVLGVLPDGGGGAGAGAFGGGVMAAMSGAMGLLGRGPGRATTVRTRPKLLLSCASRRLAAAHTAPVPS